MPEVRYYLLGQLVTVTGNWVQTVGIGILAARLGGDPLLVGLASSLRHLPLLVFGPFVGRFLDRRVNGKIVVASQICGGVLSSIFIGVLALGTMTLSLLLLFALVLGFLNVLDTSARTTWPAYIVSEGQISRVISWANIISGLARIAGPAMAAGLIFYFPISITFIINALSYGVAAALFLGTLKLAASGNQFETAPIKNGGMLAVITDRELGATLALSLAVSLFAMNSQVVMLFLLKDRLHVADSWYGAFLGVFGLGGLLGAFGSKEWKRPQLTQLVGLTVALSIDLFALGLSSSVLTLTPVALVGGVLVGSFVTASNTLLQVGAGPDRQGATMALYVAAGTGSAPLGALLAGKLTLIGGPAAAYGYLGICLLCFSTAAWAWGGRPVSNRDQN